MNKRFFFLLVLVLLLPSCALFPDLDDESKDWTARQLYQASKAAMDSADYETALEHLETLESRYPFGPYAQQAQMDIIYAYYKFDEPESAIAAADRFIKLYPRHPKVDYAYYMRGLASFNKGMSNIDLLFNLDPSTRDPRAAQESFQYFSSLIKSYPSSLYASDAAQRLVYLHNRLAQYELHVADYYMRRGAYVAAANRAQYILRQYQRTPAARQALVLLAQAYDKLGLDDLATDTRQVAALNAAEDKTANADEAERGD